MIEQVLEPGSVSIQEGRSLLLGSIVRHKMDAVGQSCTSIALGTRREEFCDFGLRVLCGSLDFSRV